MSKHYIKNVREDNGQRWVSGAQKIIGHLKYSNIQIMGVIIYIHPNRISSRWSFIVHGVAKNFRWLYVSK